MVRTAAAAVVEATVAREAAANQQRQRAVPAAAAAEGQRQKTSGRCGGVMCALSRVSTPYTHNANIGFNIFAIWR
jgi:hypothetical protein